MKLHSAPPVRALLYALTVLLAVPVTLPAQAGQDKDPYLQEINAEGNRLEFLGQAKAEHEQLLRLEATDKTPAATRPAAPARSERPAAAAAPVNQGAFESALRQKFPGNYALYNLMSTDEKRQVYDEYQKNGVEGTARFIPAVRRIITITTASSANRARVRSNTN